MRPNLASTTTLSFPQHCPLKPLFHTIFPALLHQPPPPPPPPPHSSSDPQQAPANHHASIGERIRSATMASEQVRNSTDSNSAGNATAPTNGAARKSGEDAVSSQTSAFQTAISAWRSISTAPSITVEAACLLTQ